TCDPLADQPVELGEAGAVAHVRDRVAEDREQELEQTLVLRFQTADDDVLRVVAPVAVHAHPDLEQGRLAPDDRPVAGRGERPDALSRPDERMAARELDPAAVA